MVQKQDSSFGIHASMEPVVLNDSKVEMNNRLVQVKGDCCGCTSCMTACPVGAISMIADTEGFMYPDIDSGLCVNCGRCNEACAFKLAKRGDVHDSRDMEQRCFAAKHTSESIRLASSSGGLYWTFSERILDLGGVVYGAAFSEGLEVHHVRCEDTEQAKRCMGSKYSQSAMDDCYASVVTDLKEGRSVLFTGTPCQIDGLNRLLSVRKVNTEKLLTADIICHGVPSPKVFSKHIDFIASERSSPVVAYWHRPKNNGWRHEEMFSLENGVHESGTILSRLWKRVFYSNLALRCSCYVCPYAKPDRMSDITIGDFWGIRDCHPELMDETGVSALLVNTKKGYRFLESLSNLELHECTFDDVLPKNPLLSRPSYLTRSRQRFWNRLANEGYASTVRKYRWYGVRRILIEQAKRLLYRLNA